MKGEKGEFYERKMRMWKMRDELINSMGEKELRAFIKGYMMGQRSARKHAGWPHGGGSCGCGDKSCNCDGK